MKKEVNIERDIHFLTKDIKRFMFFAGKWIEEYEERRKTFEI